MAVGGLCRFLKYAKLIRHLEVKIPESENVRSVKNSAALLAYAKTHTILPNLQSLTIRSYYNPDMTYDWAIALFSPTLLEIKCKSSLHARPPLSLTGASLWLESIASKCPNLELLELYPYFESPELDEEVPEYWTREANEPTVEDFSWQLHRFTEFKQLHTLYINTNLTHDQYHTNAIANIPNLERLGVYSGHQLDALFICPDLSSPVFPKLRHLDIRNLQWRDLEAIWRMESVIQALESLHLVIGPKPDPEDDSAEWDELNSWFPSNVVSKFQQLTELTLSLDFSDRGGIETLFERELEPLSHLPLQYVFISGLALDTDSSGDEAPSPCEVLARLWPNIQELHWPDQPATSHDLIYFATLPQLRHLTLDVELMPAPEDLDDIAAGSETFQVLECSKPESCGSTSKDRKQAAR
ncbi:hypothetical protein FRC07_003120 [Ceratobasidium sp. 392]|nr:hypothetical protein FRC07_003120 [Ceratobasidium sp. 392]